MFGNCTQFPFSKCKITSEAVKLPLKHIFTGGVYWAVVVISYATPFNEKFAGGDTCTCTAVVPPGVATPEKVRVIGCVAPVVGLVGRTVTSTPTGVAPEPTTKLAVMFLSPSSTGV